MMVCHAFAPPWNLITMSDSLARRSVILTFTVQESKIIKAADLKKYVAGDITDEKQLTLVTCTYEYGRKGWRRVVICKMN